MKLPYPPQCYYVKPVTGFGIQRGIFAGSHSPASSAPPGPGPYGGKSGGARHGARGGQRGPTTSHPTRVRAGAHQPRRERVQDPTPTAAPAGAPPRGGNEEGPPSAHQSRDGQLVAAWLSPHATPHPTPPHPSRCRWCARARSARARALTHHHIALRPGPAPRTTGSGPHRRSLRKATHSAGPTSGRVR